MPSASLALGRNAGTTAPLPALASERRARRALLLKWLRKMHGWIGLWGAVLGLLFGASGILLNHRNVLKIPAAQVQETSIELALPTPAPANAAAMADWLQQSLALDRAPTKVKSEPARPVAWGDAALRQPARWSVAFSAPNGGVQADYWVGNRFVSVKRSSNNLFATVSNLHKGSGMGIGWILLVDTLAGSIILLSLSGVLLWALMARRRLPGLVIGGASLALMCGLVWQAI
jgi:hypothetical protein